MIWFGRATRVVAKQSSCRSLMASKERFESKPRANRSRPFPSWLPHRRQHHYYCHSGATRPLLLTLAPLLTFRRLALVRFPLIFACSSSSSSPGSFDDVNHPLNGAFQRLRLVRVAPPPKPVLKRVGWLAARPPTSLRSEAQLTETGKAA